MNWRKNIIQEHKEEAYLKSMRKASDTYSKRRDALLKKYELGEEFPKKEK